MKESPVLGAFCLQALLWTMREIRRENRPDELCSHHRHRAMVRRKWTYQQGRKPGRPSIDAELERWILQVAKDNPGLGYEKLAGELRKLGFDVSKTTVSTVLERHGILPAPERGREGSSWRVFLISQFLY